MERRQRWLESQFRRQDECLSKIAKQLQVLQDFISLNFDSYRQYAVEREREDRINHLTYGNVDKPHHGGYHQDSPQHAHNHNPQYTSRLTPIPGPDSFIRHAPSLPPSSNMESDYEDGETMDPAQEDNDPAVSNAHAGVVVDLSTTTPDRRRYPLVQQQQQQEPNSTTVSDYAVAAYYNLASGCNTEEMVLPDSGLVDEGPTDLSTPEKKIDREIPTYQTGGNAQGSILGGILTSNIPPKIKTEIKDEEDLNHCYSSYPRNRTASTDSTSKDKEYSSQALWSAGTVTTLTGTGVGGIGPGSTCSGDDIPEQIPPPPRHRPKGRPRKDAQLQHLLQKKDGPKRRRGSNNNNDMIAPSSSVSRRSPSSTTTGNTSGSETSSSSTSGRKSGSKDSNASKQCRFCGKTFQWLHSVKTHERLHTGIKPYACKICGARFTQNGNLKVHAKTCVEKHAESYRSRNVMICSVCTEMFSDSDALMDHQKSHDRMQWTIKEKTCQLCGEVFQKRSFLLEHEKVHVQDRSFLSSLGIEAEAKSAAGGITSGTPPPSSTTGNTDNGDK